MFSTAKILAAHRPYHAPELTTISATGAYSYTVPIWCDRVDIVLIGGGKGGQNGAFLNPGEGGQAATWLSITMVRGVGIPWTANSITGSVGAGGTSGSGNGGNTTATATGMTTQTANGQTALVASGTAGQARANLTFNGQVYSGASGGAGGNPGTPGGAPGAGGGGGNGTGAAGGAGGAGRIFFYAYQN